MVHQQSAEAKAGPFRKEPSGLGRVPGVARPHPRGRATMADVSPGYRKTRPQYQIRRPRKSDPRCIRPVLNSPGRVRDGSDRRRRRHGDRGHRRDAQATPAQRRPPGVASAIKGFRQSSLSGRPRRGPPSRATLSRLHEARGKCYGFRDGAANIRGQGSKQRQSGPEQYRNPCDDHVADGIGIEEGTDRGTPVDIDPVPSSPSPLWTASGQTERW